MKQFLYCLGVICILMGVRLTLPSYALAQPSGFPPCTTLLSDNPNGLTVGGFIVYGVSEASGGEIANCDIAASSSLRSGQTPIAADLLESGASGTPGSFSSSDQLTVTRFAPGSSHTVVTLVSDAGEGTAESPALSTPTIDSTDNQTETATCTFTTAALIGNSFFGNCFELGTDLHGRSVGLVAQSDIPPVPEPSTVLLLGSGVVPFAFGYLKRRGRAKQHTSAA